MGGAIEIALRGIKENDCAEQTMMVQLSMVDGLRKAASFEIASGPAALDDELVLRDVNGVELLRFEVDDLSALEVGEWQLESYSVAGEETLADADQPAVLHFRAKRSNDARRQSTGKATGSSGCNGFKADYYRYADAISFGPIDRTEAPCTPAVTAQEEAMLSVLDATSSWLALEPNLLRVSSAEADDSLTFVSSRPLEGSTWLVARIPGVTGLGGEVTLRLEDGTATGQGPCGPYAAAYVSDGLFITFREVVGPADEACAAVAAERAWFAALRQTVRLDQDQPQLRLVDARGDVTARLKAPSGP
jgi:heat shock protein HslJ